MFDMIKLIYYYYIKKVELMFRVAVGL